MKKCKILLIQVLAFVLTFGFLACGTCLAQAADSVNTSKNSELKTTAEDSSEGAVTVSTNRMPVISKELEEFPYIALVTGDDVNVRSGPATPYYPVCKVNKGQEVIVTMVRPGKTNWSRIEPVPGAIAYIAEEYVEILENAAVQGAKNSGVDILGKEVLTGIVTGSDVRVRAGSVDMAPENAYRVLMLAQKGQQLVVLGKSNGYYKIVPPRGSYFWVASEYLSLKENTTSTDVVSLRDETAENLEKVVEPGELQGQYVTLKAILDKYDAVQSLPLMERDYTSLKEEVQKLADTTDSPAVKKTAEVLVKNIITGVSAQKQITASIEQDKKIEDAMLKIDQAVVQALKEMTPADTSPDVVVVKGKLEKSAVFTSGVSKRFIMLDGNGLISCYVSGDNLEAFIGKNVSVSGPASYDPFGKTRVIEAVKVVEIATDPQ